MSSNKIFFEYGGTPYSTVVPEGQEVTEEYMQKVFKKIEKQKKEKAQATLYASATSDSGSGTENKEKEYENIVQSSGGQADAEKAKEKTLELGAQTNFEDLAQDEVSKTTFSNNFQKESTVFENVFSAAPASTMEDVADRAIIDVANSEVAEKIATETLTNEAAMSVAIEGLQELNAQEDDAYLFMNKDKEDEGLLDVNAHKNDAPEKEEGILNRNVSEKEKAADGVLDVEVKDLTGVEPEKKTETHHLSPVQELDQDAHEKKAEEKLHNTENSAALPQKDGLQKVADSDVLKDTNLQNSAQLGNSKQLEKSKERLPNAQEKTEQDKKSKETSSEKEKEKSKSLDKTNGKEKNGKVKQKVDKEKVEQLLELTGRKLPKGKKNGEKEAGKEVAFRYSQIANKDQSSSKIKEANNQNSAALRKALGVGRGR